MTRLAAVLTALVLVTAACGGSDASPDVTVPPVELTPLTTAASTTVPVTAAPAATTTVPPATSTTAVAAATTTTVQATTTTTTTGVAPAPPCALDLIVQQTETTYEGITPTDLRCADVWATWVGMPDDPMMSDGFFAVAKWDGNAWQLANLGTAEICGDAGVPDALWDTLNCIE
jgi:hypothetical protein